ncbi:hypothetical protein [Cohnella sp.]|uniref:hypothetical protein n=1 Tax=Cohnella sp. TaxID=1883426 RepID=UPI0035690FE8
MAKSSGERIAAPDWKIKPLIAIPDTPPNSLVAFPIPLASLAASYGTADIEPWDRGVKLRPIPVSANIIGYFIIPNFRNGILHPNISNRNIAETALIMLDFKVES